MAEYTEPTQTEFDSAEAVVMDILTQGSPTVMHKKGSVIHELIVRPISYLYAWATGKLDKEITESSIAFLSTSQATENTLADEVASNYFVSRNAGRRSSGVITLTMNTPTAHISQGASFQVGDQECVTPYQIVITSTATTDVVDGVKYVQSTALGDVYIANVPVQVTEIGRIELPVGSEVVVLFPNSFVEAAELTSPITGGSDVETDAELFARAKHNTADASVGSYSSLMKKLQQAPINVYGMALLAGEDSLMQRARFNNTNVNPGGFVDAYVKTQQQASTEAVNVTATKSDSVYTCQIQDTNTAGQFRVVSVTADGEEIDTFDVAYGTSDAAGTGEGSRLSSSQTITISFEADSSEDTLDTRVVVEYMPGISILQNFIDSDENRFIGQDIRIKAAVPVITRFDCAAYKDGEISEEEMTTLKNVIVDTINSSKVGTKTLNFSDIVRACRNTLPNIELRLPCNLSGQTATRSGAVDTFYSSTGILDIGCNANEDCWDPSICFFSTSFSNVRVSQI